jgi:hypothetical protein
MAIWFLAFSGSLTAGVVGTLLYALDGPTRRMEAARTLEISTNGIGPVTSLN